MVDLHRLPRQEFLKNPLFKNLTNHQVDQIIQSAHKTVRYEGEFFFLQGEPAEKMFVLVEGRVRLHQTSREGEQVLIHIIKPYHVFALVAMTQTQNYPVSAQAAVTSEAIYWSRQELMEFVINYPVMAMNAMQFMAEQVKEMQERFRQTATERVNRRLARTLLRLSSQSGRKVEEGILIDMPLTRQELAEMSGTTLFTVSRILTQWEEQGIVTSTREKVIIRYPHGLLEIIEGEN